MQVKKIKIIKVSLEGRKNLLSGMVAEGKQSTTLLHLEVRASNPKASGMMP